MTAFCEHDNVTGLHDGKETLVHENKVANYTTVPVSLHLLLVTQL